MKKKILIAIPALPSGGVEVSLIRFLNELSKNKDLSIDLLMLSKTGIYLKDVPKNVNIIEVSYDDEMYNYNNQLKDHQKYKNIFKKIKYLSIRLKLRHFVKINDWENYYKTLLPHVKQIDKEYDLAIDWHGYGHFITTIVAEKVNARKKAMWIHDENNTWLNKVKYWNNCFDKIFCVGISCLKNVKKNSEELKDKVEVFYNMTDYQNVRKKATMKSDIKLSPDKLNIVSVGRLEWQKGYDVAIDVAAELKKQNLSFNWYVIGGGAKEKELKAKVAEKDLTDCFIFLGIVSNPFPIEAAADLYVLSSRHEGYCLATLEAKILNKVIIATDIESNREQIKNGVNGFLCKLDAKEFSKTIIKVSKDKTLQKKIIKNLSQENFDYTSEFDKLYKLMEE